MLRLWSIENHLHPPVVCHYILQNTGMFRSDFARFALQFQHVAKGEEHKINYMRSGGLKLLWSTDKNFPIGKLYQYATKWFAPSSSSQSLPGGITWKIDTDQVGYGTDSPVI